MPKIPLKPIKYALSIVRTKASLFARSLMSSTTTQRHNILKTTEAKNSKVVVLLAVVSKVKLVKSHK